MNCCNRISSNIMESIKIPVISITVLGFLLSYLAFAGAITNAGQEKASYVVVVGKVFCDTCLEHRLSENGYVISGASIAVECGLTRKMMTISVMGETDENGEFKVELPSTIFQSANQLNNCWVRPRNSPYDSCKFSTKSAPSKLIPESVSNGVVTYSAGSFSYRHENVPESCYREDFLKMMRGRAMAEDVDQSSKAGQQVPTIPSLLQFPPATLPSVPPLPKFSVPPLPKTPLLASVPPLPKISPLSCVPLPKISPLPQFSAPPLPKISPLPQFSAPPLPKISPLPQFSVPPLPKIPPMPQLSFPPFPKPTIPGSPPFPQIPQIPNFQFPPIPFLTPPPPGQ